MASGRRRGGRAREPAGPYSDFLSEEELRRVVEDARSLSLQPELELTRLVLARVLEWYSAQPEEERDPLKLLETVTRAMGRMATMARVEHLLGGDQGYELMELATRVLHEIRSKGG